MSTTTWGGRRDCCCVVRQLARSGRAIGNRATGGVRSASTTGVRVGEAEAVLSEMAMSFEEFYVDRYAWAVRFAYGLTGDRELAEDVAQHVFVGLARRWVDVATPVSYLRAGIVNGVRSANRRSVVERRNRVNRVDASTPSSLVEFADVLNDLPQRQRMVLVLRYLEDLDDVEIARLLGCRRATVRSLVHRALGRLREVLSDG